MTEVTTIFWDVGGVLLSNGWDRATRRCAADQFGLDWEEFQERHDLVAYDFDVGRITLDNYLKCTVFHRERSFAPETFKAYMFDCSVPLSGALEMLARLAVTKRYLMATLNNESFELNAHRIERFKLRECFTFFISSCFVGRRKPEPEIYQLALQVSQRAAKECLFIDDRALNVERARQVGMRAIQYRSSEELIAELVSCKVTWN